MPTPPAAPPVVLFEDAASAHLRPLTLTRPVGHLLLGIDPVAAKWARALPGRPHRRWTPGLRGALFNTFSPSGLAGALLINARYLPHPSPLVARLGQLPPQQALVDPRCGSLVAAHVQGPSLRALGNHLAQPLDVDHWPDALRPSPLAEMELPDRLQHVGDLFRLNGAWLRLDFAAITAGRRSAPLDDPHTAIYNPEAVFAEPGARTRAAVLDAEAGPIYLGRNVDIQAGALVQGAHAFLDGAVLNMGAKLRGDTTLGPRCKVGGEVSNSVFTGYSNKAHDGFVGNSVLGTWCNLGADTNTSNLKNNYSPVRVHDYPSARPLDTGMQFFGLAMGDHSKTGINTMLNTGTVVGVSANVFGGGFPPKHIPSFAWGGQGPESRFRIEEALEVMQRVMARRSTQLTPAWAAFYRQLHRLGPAEGWANV